MILEPVEPPKKITQGINDFGAYGTKKQLLHEEINDFGAYGANKKNT